MKRREFVRLLGMPVAIQAWPLFAQTDVPLVALIVPGSATQAADRIVALRAGLREGGLAEGTHYTLAVRFGDGVVDHLPGLIQELAALKPRLIVSGGVAFVVKRVLPDMPHVFTAIAVDPVKLGLVDSYAHPGGNVTGNVLSPGGDKSMTQKRVDLLRQLMPSLKRIGFIGTTTNVLAVEELDALRSLAARLGIEVAHHAIRTTHDIEQAVIASAKDGVDVLYLSGEPLLISNIEHTVKVITASGKPALGTVPDWARAGLLMSYSADVPDGFRRAGIYAAKILHGEKPGNLPIEQASKFTLVVNAVTARRLGITVPPTFLADEVIE